MTRSSFAFVTAASDHVNRCPGHRRAEELKTKDKSKTDPPPTTKEADPKIKVTERARIEVRPLRVESIKDGCDHLLVGPTPDVARPFRVAPGEAEGSDVGEATLKVDPRF